MTPEFQLGFYTELMKISQDVQMPASAASAMPVAPVPNPPGPQVPAVKMNTQAGQQAAQAPGTGPAAGGM